MKRIILPLMVLLVVLSMPVMAQNQIVEQNQEPLFLQTEGNGSFLASAGAPGSGVLSTANISRTLTGTPVLLADKAMRSIS